MNQASPGPETSGFDAQEIVVARLRRIIQDLLVRFTEINVGIETERFRSLADIQAFITQVVQAPVVAVRQQGGNPHDLPPHYKQADWQERLACPPAPLLGLAERNQVLEKLFWLAARDVVFFSTYNDTIGDWDDGWHPAVNLNDTFCYACADADPVRDDELDLLIDVYRRFGDDGVTAWAAVKRNTVPIAPRQTETYHAARRYLNEQAAGRQGDKHA